MPRRLNATAASLLGLLHAEPMTGWEVTRRAEESLGNFWSLTQSQVYRELAAMADDGLVTGGARGPRDRRTYTITDAGRAAFVEWLAEPPGHESIRYPLLLTVAFGQHLDPGVLRRLLAEQRDVHRRRLAGYEQRRAELADEPWALATLAFGLQHERATLAWFEELDTLLPASP